MGLDQSEWGNGGVHVQLIPLAHGTSFHVLVHELCEARPLEFHGNELTSFEVTQVSDSLMVMAVGEDGATEGGLWGNVDMILVHKDVIIKFPVQEARLEGGGDILQG